MFTPVSIKGKLFRFYLLFPAHPSKIRIQNFLGRILFPGGIKISNEEGVLFVLDANDWITRILLLQGNYETLSLVQAKKILQNGGTFVDVGANFGLYTCTLAQQNKATRAYAIEPNYQVLSRLINNIRQNKNVVRYFNSM